MTQHPFDREYSEQEAQKLNSESTAPANENELTDEEAEDVAGGKYGVSAGILGAEEGIINSSTRPSSPMTRAKWENGGPWTRD